MLIISITYIAIGVIMIMNKQESNKQVIEILAYGLSIAGLLSMIRYFLINVRERFKRNDFLLGALLISLAAIIYLSKNDITYLVGKLIAIAMMISGISKIQDLFDTKAAGKRCIGIYLFGFTICVIFGLIVLFDIIKNIDTLYIVIGIGMCICGISDIASNFYVAYAIANYEKTWAERAKVKEVPEEVVEANSVPEEIVEVNELQQEEVAVEEENEDVPLE